MRTGKRNFDFFGAVFMIIAWVSASTIAFADDEYRLWTDATGKNKIKAKFVKLEDKEVTLEKEDGEEVAIALKKLSSADQKFVAEAIKDTEDSPFKKKSDDPFKTKPKTKTKAKPKPDDSKDDPGNPRQVAVNLSSADHVLLANTSDEWNIKIPADESPKKELRTKPIAIPGKSNFFEGLKGMAFNRGGDSRTAILGFLLDNQQAGAIRLASCDLIKGVCKAPVKASGKMAPIAVHDDGRQIIMRREEFGFGNQDRLEVWELEDGKISKTLSWIPYDADMGGARDVMWAAFVDSEQLVTSSREGKVVIWKFPEIEPVCYFETENGAVPALSPDRKLIAYSNGKDVGLFDIDKKEVIAQQAAPFKLQWPYMAFSPSATRLACLAFDKVLVWDLATGKLERTIPCTGLNVHGSIEFPDDNFVLAGNKFLIDLENQLKLWTYDGAEHVRVIDRLTYFAVTDGENKPGALIPLKIPHPDAKKLLEKALTDPNLFVLKAGTAVRIDVNGISDASQRERVAKALSKQLDEIGCKGGTTGTIDIVASVEGPKDVKLSYRNSGDYNFKEYTSRVKFVYQNQSAWETASSNNPGFIVHLKAGENMESHLRSREKPGYEFFDRVQLPKFLQKPTGGQAAGNSLTIGKSQVTTAGLR